MPNLLDELAQWIDTTVIAQAIVEEMEEQELKPTLKNAQSVWLDVLEVGLPDALKSSVEAHWDRL